MKHFVRFHFHLSFTFNATEKHWQTELLFVWAHCNFDHLQMIPLKHKTNIKFPIDGLKQCKWTGHHYTRATYNGICSNFWHLARECGGCGQITHILLTDSVSWCDLFWLFYYRWTERCKLQLNILACKPKPFWWIITILWLLFKAFTLPS